MLPDFSALRLDQCPVACHGPVTGKRARDPGYSNATLTLSGSELIFNVDQTTSVFSAIRVADSDRKTLVVIAKSHGDGMNYAFKFFISDDGAKDEVARTKAMAQNEIGIALHDPPFDFMRVKANGARIITVQSRAIELPRCSFAMTMHAADGDAVDYTKSPHFKKTTLEAALRDLTTKQANKNVYCFDQKLRNVLYTHTLNTTRFYLADFDGRFCMGEYGRIPYGFDLMYEEEMFNRIYSAVVGFMFAISFGNDKSGDSILDDSVTYLLKALSERGSDEYNILKEMDSHGDDVFRQVRLYTKRLIEKRFETGESRDELLYMMERPKNTDSGRLFYCLLAYCRWAEHWHRERGTDVARVIVKASDTATKLINARYGKRVAFARLQEAAAETKRAGYTPELNEELLRAMEMYNAKKSALNELLQDDVPKFQYPQASAGGGA